MFFNCIGIEKTHNLNRNSDYALNLVYSFLNSLCRTLVRFALPVRSPLQTSLRHSVWVTALVFQCYLPKHQSLHPLFKSRSSFYRLYTCQPQNCGWFCMWTVFLFLQICDMYCLVFRLFGLVSACIPLLLQAFLWPGAF